MADLLVVTALLLSVWLICSAMLQFFRGHISGKALSMLGLGGLVLLDIPRQYWGGNVGGDSIGVDQFAFSASIVLLSALMIGLGWLFGVRTFLPRNVVQERIVSSERVRALWVGAAIAVAGLALIGSKSGYFALLTGAIRGALILIVCYSIYYRRHRLALLGFALLVISLVGFDVSSRRSYIVVFAPIFIAIVARFSVGGLKISVGKRAVLFVLGLLAFVSLNALRMHHDFGEGYDPNDPIGNTISYVTTLRSVDTFSNTAFIIQNFPKTWDYFYGSTYVSVFVAPIPRAYWVDKPVGLAAPLGLMRKMGVRDFDSSLWREASMFSLSPGFVGEAWANGGIAGVILLSLLLGTSMAWFDARVFASGFAVDKVPWYCFSPVFLLVHRGDFYSALNFSIYMAIGAAVAVRLCSRRARRMGRSGSRQVIRRRLT